MTIDPLVYGRPAYGSDTAVRFFYQVGNRVEWTEHGRRIVAGPQFLTWDWMHSANPRDWRRGPSLAHRVTDPGAR